MQHKDLADMNRLELILALKEEITSSTKSINNANKIIDGWKELYEAEENRSSDLLEKCESLTKMLEESIQMNKDKIKYIHRLEAEIKCLKTISLN